MAQKSPIKEVYDEVAALKLPPEYALKAFEIALKSKLGGGGNTTKAATPAAPAAPKHNPVDPGDDGGPNDKVANALGLSVEDASNMFKFVDGKPVLRVRTTALPNSDKASTEELAVLLGTAYESVGLELSSTDLNKALDDFGKFNSSNFASYLAKTPADQISVKRKAKEKVYPIKVRQPGRERAREIAARLVGAE